MNKFESCFMNPEDEVKYEKLLINDQGKTNLYTNVIRNKSVNDEYGYKDYNTWYGDYPGGDHLTEKIKIDGKVGRQELYWRDEMYPYIMWISDKKGKKNKIEPYSGLNYDNQRGMNPEFRGAANSCEDDYPTGRETINRIDKREKKYNAEYGIYTDMSDFDEVYDNIYDLH